MNKLIVCIMGQDCQRFLPMCLESVKDADGIIFCDGGSTDKTGEILKEFIVKNKWLSVIKNDYNQEDKTMNGKQRNFYLKYLKENYPNDWALCIDADEVVESLADIKKFIQTAENGLYSVKMRHFIGNLGFEDASQPFHVVLNRLFKISEAGVYPEVEHPVLTGNVKGATDCTTIWHLSYIPNTWEIKKKYENHLKKSNMHTPEYLKSWYWQHLFGRFPVKPINIKEIPDIILKEFGIDKDEVYYLDRGIELKHSIMVKQWQKYFKPKSVLDLGCGLGCYLFYWEQFTEHCIGLEISKWACEHKVCESPVHNMDISKDRFYDNCDLITAIDVLEHLDNEQLDRTLQIMAKYGKRFLFSIPFKGDPNLMADKTHKQFRTREEWKTLIESHGIKVELPPSDWLFANQIYVGTKK